MTTVDATATLVGFGRTLRAAGVDADAARLAAFTEAVAALRPGRTDDVYWAGRLTLCSDPADLPRYDRAFRAYFTGDLPPVRRRRTPVPDRRGVPAPVADTSSPGGDEGDDAGRRTRLATASGVEVLRHRDIAELDPADREALRALLAAFRLPGSTRRTRRRRPAPTGRVDARRTVRAVLRRGGEVDRLHRTRPRTRPRRVVLIVDVSGSMTPYAEALLRFAHAASRGRRHTEVFTLGTRLTRVTRELDARDPDRAMAALAAAVPDWSGGTRLGDLLTAWLDGWGQRGMARGAVVVVLSDGWDCGDPGTLTTAMARLGRLAHRVVWANPRIARPGFAPTATGMAAALPYVDDFVEGHSLAALEHLAAVVAGRVSADA